MASDIEHQRFKIAEYVLTFPFIFVGALLMFALGLGLGMKIGHATALKQQHEISTKE